MTSSQHDAVACPTHTGVDCSFNKDLIAGVQFQPLSLPGVVVDYDFCVQDVTFLDSAGGKVSP